MNKKLTAICIISVLIAICLSGCNENSSDNKNNNFLGRWYGSYFGASSEVEVEIELIFYDNDTARIIYYSVEDNITIEMLKEWHNYTIEDSNVCFIVTTMADEEPLCYNYEFSNSYTTLTLTYRLDPKIKMVLTKQTE